ncbi:MAG TPA: cytochrome c [Methylomirabilota bacterium]|nr:cytochrome c [Methylomirabilota bacterium]
MRSIATVAWIAGFACVGLAMVVQGVLPALAPETRTTRVTRAVRTDLGDVKWVRADATDYTALERRGRAVYVREGCWYCHSQYVRPVAGEEFRWGPVSEAGEYAHDQPHLLGTRRIGPDLTRVGLKYSDDWHYAHTWNPRIAVPESIMPRFRWLFDETTVATRDGRLAPEALATLRRWFTMRGDRTISLFVNAAGAAFVRPAATGFPVDGIPVLDFDALRGERDTTAPPPATVRLVAPSADMIALVRYLQKLGTNRGAWRDVFEPQNVAVAGSGIPDTDANRELGKEVFTAHCVGCHGERGDGTGAAATFLSPLPRDFTAGVFKFRTTPSGTLPTDGDLARTITRGVRGTAMPTWHEVTEKERLAVVTYLKTLSKRWNDDAPEAPLVIPPPPRATPPLLADGKVLYERAKCAECHGEHGKGDGPSAATLKDDFDRPIRPADFTRGEFKGGSSVTDVYRTMSTGLDGTPMPSFADTMSDADRWAISYYVLSLSAWVDPLTGRPLPLAPETKAALNAASTTSRSPGDAFEPDGARRAIAAGRTRWPRGMQE